MKRLGVQYAMLHADPDLEELMPSLRRFYRRHGFEEILEYRGSFLGFPLMMAKI
jgi:hypothetical protein